MRSIRTCALVLGLGALAAPAVLRAQQPPTAPPAERTIRVVGVGQARATPDEAYLSFGVETTAPTAKAAADENARLMQQVMQALVSTGVPRQNIQTSNFSVFPDYGPPRPGTEEPTLRGYRVTNMVTARTEEIARVGPLVDAALAAGANRVHGIRFGLKNAEPVQAEAIRSAVAKARNEAQAIAAALGVRLGPVLDASTTGTPPRPYAMEAVAMRADYGGGPPPPTPIEAGEQTVTAMVTLVFGIQ